MEVMSSVLMKDYIMNKTTFLLACQQHLIDPDLALENDNVIAAIKENNLEKLNTIFASEF